MAAAVARLLNVEDLVAIAVSLDTGDKRYFMTWGRIQDATDPRLVEALVLRFAFRCDLGGKPVEAQLCRSLREASGEPYFYEALFEFSRGSRPSDDEYEAWQASRAEAMEQGGEISYRGRP